MFYLESVLNLRRIFVFPVIKCIFWQFRIKFFVYLFKLKGLLSHANHWVLGRYQHSCPARRVRTSAVSVGKAVCRVPGPRGVWWDWPSTKVTTSLPCLPESPKGGESGVAAAVIRN